MRARLATTLVKLAESEQREGVFLTQVLAAGLLRRASELNGDAALKSRAESLRADFELLRDAHHCLAPLLHLPIRSLQDAWAEQVANERAVAQQAARMGLSCPESKD